VGVISNLLGRIRPGYYIDRAEEAMWEAASTMADVGELTALWLEGRIQHQPGYCAPVDVDEDDVPGLANLLAACCRAGYVTTTSQAAFDGTGYDGAHWQQRAAVEGFADPETINLLYRALRGTGIEVHAARCTDRGPWPPWRPVLPVTVREGDTVTDFGGPRRASDIADGWTGYGICQKSAVAELIEAWQVLVYDPEWGRNDRLWPALAQFAAG
jgi:hypothetical protein